MTRSIRLYRAAMQSRRVPNTIRARRSFAIMRKSCMSTIISRLIGSRARFAVRDERKSKLEVRKELKNEIFDFRFRCIDRFGGRGYSIERSAKTPDQR